jgi:hypothetical protein
VVSDLPHDRSDLALVTELNRVPRRPYAKTEMSIRRRQSRAQIVTMIAIGFAVAMSAIGIALIATSKDPVRGETPTSADPPKNAANPTPATSAALTSAVTPPQTATSNVPPANATAPSSLATAIDPLALPQAPPRGRSSHASSASAPPSAPSASAPKPAPPSTDPDINLFQPKR